LLEKRIEVVGTSSTAAADFRVFKVVGGLILACEFGWTRIVGASEDTLSRVLLAGMDYHRFLTDAAG